MCLAPQFPDTTEEALSPWIHMFSSAVQQRAKTKTPYWESQDEIIRGWWTPWDLLFEQVKGSGSCSALSHRTKVAEVNLDLKIRKAAASFKQKCRAMTLETSLSFSVVLFFHLCVILPLLPALSPGYIFPLKQEHCDLSFFFKKKKVFKIQFYFIFKTFWLHGRWDLSSPTRESNLSSHQIALEGNS